MKPIALVRAEGALYLVPFDTLLPPGVAVLGIAALTPEQENLAREIAALMLRDAQRPGEAA